ncbi:MAG: hypothetical protein LWW97_03120 [Deltaproteobacteria bacterium]|nr:hypothetical protein [Deltaproteobacteria bacterium]
MGNRKPHIFDQKFGSVVNRSIFPENFLHSEGLTGASLPQKGHCFVEPVGMLSIVWGFRVQQPQMINGVSDDSQLYDLLPNGSSGRSLVVLLSRYVKP